MRNATVQSTENRVLQDLYGQVNAGIQRVRLAAPMTPGYEPSVTELPTD